MLTAQRSYLSTRQWSGCASRNRFPWRRSLRRDAREQVREPTCPSGVLSSNPCRRLGAADETTGEATGMTLTTAILMLLSAMGGAALAVFAMAAFIVGGRSDDFPAARVDRKVPARKGGQAMRA